VEWPVGYDLQEVRSLTAQANDLIEAPAYRSREQRVEVAFWHHPKTGERSTTLVVPFHIRYAAPGSSTYGSFQLEPPSVSSAVCRAEPGWGLVVTGVPLPPNGTKHAGLVLFFTIAVLLLGNLAAITEMRKWHNNYNNHRRKTNNDECSSSENKKHGARRPPPTFSGMVRRKQEEEKTTVRGLSSR
jgi:hypothetical protein